MRKRSQIHDGGKSILKTRGKETLEANRLPEFSHSLHSVVQEGSSGVTFNPVVDESLDSPIGGKKEHVRLQSAVFLLKQRFYHEMCGQHTMTFSYIVLN